MALTNCPDCERAVSDAATSCPSCGRPIHQIFPPEQLTDENGLLYPPVRDFLLGVTNISIAKSLRLGPWQVDLLVIIFVATETAIGLSLGSRGVTEADRASITVWLLLLLQFYRILDVVCVHLCEFFVGYYRDTEPWILNRAILLKVINVAEILLLYGMALYCLSRMYPDAFGMNVPFACLFDAIYFSVVTGTTLGFGDNYPKGPGAKALVMSEVLFLLLFGLAILSFLKGRSFGVPDIDQIRRGRGHQ